MQLAWERDGRPWPRARPRLETASACLLLPHARARHRTENGKCFEEVVLDGVIAGERSWREKTDIDVHTGIYRDPETQTILSMR
jgi:hypothetical protein